MLGCSMTALSARVPMLPVAHWTTRYGRVGCCQLLMFTAMGASWDRDDSSKDRGDSSIKIPYCSVNVIIRRRSTLAVMHAGDFLIHPSQLGASTTDSWQPLGLVDLSAWPDSVPLRTLPPFPLIGLGDPSHPLARTLDAVVEPPVSVEALIRQVTRAPHTAAVAIQLLRSLDGLPVDRALQLESMCYGLLQGSSEHAQWLAAQSAPRQAATSGEILIDRQ